MPADRSLMDGHRCLLYFGWCANKEVALEALLESRFRTHDSG
jgi:hypothetical protein